MTPDRDRGQDRGRARARARARDRDRARTSTDPLAHMSAAEKREFAFAKRAARWVGVYVPLGLTVIAVVILMIWLPRLPDPIATHWGFGSRPDGFGPVWANIGISAGVGLGMVALFAATPYFERMKPGAAMWGWTHRFMAATSLATVTLIQLAAVVTAYVQLDLLDARTAPPIDVVMLVIGAIAVGAGLLGWFAQPKLTVAAHSEGAAVRAMPLAPNTRAVWFGTVKPGRAALWLFGATIGMSLFFVLLELVIVPSIDRAFAWGLCGVLVLVTALMVTNLWFRVRIDARGLEARAPFGWPVYRVPADDIAGVAVAQIQPFSEYGGWGVRVAPDRFGIVLRQGEGVVIRRHSRSRTFAITLDDAQTAASLLVAISAGDAGNARSSARGAR